MMPHPLEQKIGYIFRDPSLLQTALTHRSHSVTNNERLEFLGDSILDAVIAMRLFERFPELPEGDLSRLRSNLVNQESLYQLALSLSLGQYLRLGEGELKSGGVERPSTLADAVEALFGAVWLDAGFAAVEEVVASLYIEKLKAIVPGQSIKDAKTRLQEYLQGRRMPLPAYSLSKIQGEAHAQKFTVKCEIESLKICTEGHGASRRAAEQMAAQYALEKVR